MLVTLPCPLPLAGSGSAANLEMVLQYYKLFSSRGPRAKDVVNRVVSAIACQPRCWGAARATACALCLAPVLLAQRFLFFGAEELGLLGAYRRRCARAAGRAPTLLHCTSC